MKRLIRKFWKEEPCRWVGNADGFWNGFWLTGCKQVFSFMGAGSPIASGFKFCPYCGRPLLEGKP